MSVLSGSSIKSFERSILGKFSNKDYEVRNVNCKDFAYVGMLNPWGKPDGIGRMIMASNSVHEGSFYNGYPQGFGRCIDPNGVFFEGIYKMGERAGAGTLTFKDGH